MAEPDQTVLQQSQQLLPEYQEQFLKDLLANIYQTDPETGQVSGIAAISPLYGQPMLDEQGNPLFRTADGGFTSDPTQAQTDQFGVPIEAVQAEFRGPTSFASALLNSRRLSLARRVSVCTSL